ncbi:hypothetical protein [Flocculibacter collagenilyticus]|uniref:hypothetical protein n=1 Tax=Flocculibacter collagenilyticus TaxID=2744479 RepID=UPI0018F29271|nr:hypothetical protein [Flocculibacter collagenilyticus]
MKIIKSLTKLLNPENNQPKITRRIEPKFNDHVLHPEEHEVHQQPEVKATTSAPKKSAHAETIEPHVHVSHQPNKAPTVKTSNQAAPHESAQDDATHDPHAIPGLTQYWQKLEAYCSPVIHTAKQLNPKILIMGIAGIVIIVVVLLISLLSDPESNDATHTEDAAVTQAPPETVNIQARLLMPTDFSLLLDEHQSLMINWQAESSTEHTADAVSVWTLRTAVGDERCQTLTFNNAASYRPLTVERLDGYDYTATFSPLDSEAIINNIANLSHYDLCGKRFSLKGTKAALESNTSFRQFLNY